MIANRHIGRTVLVTGAASGIGRGIATRFGEEGANVVVADVRREPKQGEYYDTDIEQPTDKKITQETDGMGLYIETDVSDPDSVSNTVDEVVKEFGQLDVLINNAGIYVPGSSQEMSTEDWQQVIDVNLTGHFNCAKYAIPHLVESEGHIVNMGSVMASEGGAGPSYTSAKAAVVNLTRDLAVELGEASVNVHQSRTTRPRSRFRHSSTILSCHTAASRVTSATRRCFSPAKRRALSMERRSTSTVGGPPTESDKYGFKTIEGYCETSRRL
jgi:NAD(P)-dependent dehydrogenase (short-subunit alcohol dehydrogenase family)